MNNSEFKHKINISTGDFSIQQILECGQCFRYERLKENDYMIIAMNQLARITQMEERIELHCNEKENIDQWVKYLDLDRDYDAIKKVLSEKDHYLKEAIKDKHGIRILRQDPWEMLISFIISQNKNITHIKQLIEVISKRYGSLITTYKGKDYYAFPSVEELSNVTEEEFRKLKVGFRAPYLIDAIHKVKTGQVQLKEIDNMSYEEGLESLTTIKGVGKKVADCVLLFGYGKYEVFPTDVWVKRVMEYFYFEKDTKIEDIHSFAKSYFGDLAGFAQQYLFYHARDKKIGK